MRLPEQRQWDYLDRTMQGHWDAQRHEDKYVPDAPDVSFAMRGIDGWLELKTIPHWPKNPATPVKVGHFRPGQVNWLERRGERGSGRVWCLFAVGEDMATADWLLVPWFLARVLRDGKFTRAVWENTVPSVQGPALRGLLTYALLTAPVGRLIPDGK